MTSSAMLKSRVERQVRVIGTRDAFHGEGTSAEYGLKDFILGVLAGQYEILGLAIHASHDRASLLARRLVSRWLHVPPGRCRMVKGLDSSLLKKTCLFFLTERNERAIACAKNATGGWFCQSPQRVPQRNKTGPGWAGLMLTLRTARRRRPRRRGWGPRGARGGRRRG